MNLVLQCFLLVSIAVVLCGSVSDVLQTLRARSQMLRRVAQQGSAPRGSCNETHFVFISEYPYGRSGNNLIEFTHGLWLAKQLNRTLAPPAWMNHVLEPFDATVLESLFCYRLNADLRKPGLNILEVTSENAFFFYRVFQDPVETPTISKSLPLFNGSVLSGVLLKDFAQHFLRVYTSLWSSPLELILSSAESITMKHLGGKLSYSTIHKRSMEGGCSSLMSSCTSIDDYNSSEVPMDAPEWKANLYRNHPMCDMTASFASSILAQHNRTNNRLFLAFDGRGGVEDYTAINATIIRGEEFAQVLDSFRRETKFLEMFMAIHGDFFIMNPRSTFSFEVFVIRAALGLISVPVLRSHDFYVKNPRAIDAKNPLWVTFSSIQEVASSVQQRRR